MALSPWPKGTALLTGPAISPVWQLWLSNLVVSVNQLLTLRTAIQDGFGSPEGVVTADVGTLYRRLDGGVGTTLYAKSSGTGNTGWSALS
jgi:hypothetical protein